MRNYAWLTLKHKWFVLLAGIHVGAPLGRLLIHDMSKLTPWELPHYQRQFFGKADDPRGFIACWTRHQNRNPHHWEYWVPRSGHSRCDPPYLDNEPIPMPEWAVREMVADWMGASRAYEGRWPHVREWMWIKKHAPKMRVHSRTAQLIDIVLRELGGGVSDFSDAKAVQQ